MRDINVKSGFLFGFFFGSALSLVFSCTLVIIDIIMQKRYGFATCIEVGRFTQKTMCQFPDALLSKAILFFFLLLILGFILGFFGACIGYIIKKTSME